MSRGQANPLDVRRLLEAVEQAPPLDAVDVLADELKVMVGAEDVRLLIANFSGSGVERLSHVKASEVGAGDATERTDSLPLEGSIYEQTLREQEPNVIVDGDRCLVLLPITERGDAIGLLEVRLPGRPGADTVDHLASAAHALAYVLIASRRHTDVFEWGQRNQPFSLAAEIQRRLLPSSYTLEAGAFTLAGWLEPAHSVGGDTFDYSLEREYLYASITDAMGHSTEAALLATLAVGSSRNTRRSLASPSEQADVANSVLLEGSRDDQFVTGQFIRVRLADGRVELVNAGHPTPYLMRDRQAEEIAIPAAPALGIIKGTYETHEMKLEPGDRFLLLTDGFLERNAEPVDLPLILEETAAFHPREVVRRLADNVVSATGGELQDDAAVLCIDWHGADNEREAVAGANPASSPDI